MERFLSNKLKIRCKKKGGTKIEPTYIKCIQNKARETVGEPCKAKIPKLQTETQQLRANHVRLIVDLLFLK